MLDDLEAIERDEEGFITHLNLKAGGQEPVRLFEYLKAYLMLGQPARLQIGQLAFVADLEWRREDPETAARLKGRFDSLLEGEALRPLPVDDQLIDAARNAIATPLAAAGYGLGKPKRVVASS